MNFKKKRNPLNLAHTYSIVARDEKSGEIGVGVQSHYFNVSVVPWGESGVGVVATQSFVNKSFGLRGLDLLKKGKTPQEALDLLISEDEGREMRQVSIMDAKGNVATHTGSKCIKYAGHKIGKNYSVQANMMLSEKVWPLMAEAFEKNEDLPLAERIIKSLEAAESVGGDIRGRQSANLVIYRGEISEEKWEDPLIDLRVDDDQDDPLKELKRLLKIYRAYEQGDKADQAVEKGDFDAALGYYYKAMEMLPGDLEMKYWTAVMLANNNKVEEACELFSEVFKKDDNWRILTERLPEVDILQVGKEALKKILSS